MAGLCPVPDPAIGLVRGLAGSVDCNLQGLTASAYGALAAPGSPVAALITAFLTLYVAFIGYRLILGRGDLRVGDLAVSAVKIGAVLALAASWPAYQAVLYDTLFRAPDQIAGWLGGAGRASASALAAHPLDGLQAAYDQLGQAAQAYAGRAGGGAASLQGGPGFAAFALNMAGFALIATTLGVILAAKIVLALLLALGPLVAGFLLFDATRGLVEGWLKAMLAFAFAPLLASLVLAAELAALEPFLIQLKALLEAGRFDLGPPTAVFLLALVFAAVMGAGLVAGAVIAAGLKLPRGRPTAAPAEPGEARVTPSAPAAMEQPRVTAIAAAATAMDRRDRRTASHTRLERHGAGSATVGASAAAGAPQIHTPLGHSFRRAAQSRRSAVRRDR